MKFIPLFIIFLTLLCRGIQPQTAPQVQPPAQPVVEGPVYLGILYVVSLDGVRVVQIFPNSPAVKAGITVGDTITAANGHPIAGSYGFRYEIQCLKPGETIQLRILRNDGTHAIIQAIVEVQPPELQQWHSY